jgi:tetratricopeptide (TPR) repeat protein
VTGDRSRIFTLGLAISWFLIVALPIIISVRTTQSWEGLPLLGVVVWYLGLRLARLLSPAVRADADMRHGSYVAAAERCRRALAVTGVGAWTGTRRLVWLNRYTTALWMLGKPDEALTAALEAVNISSDPETLGNCAAALLAMNRYTEAASAARLAQSLSRERSVSANATLAGATLARGLPADAEAMAMAAFTDVQALLPLARREHYAACLAVLCRSERALKRDEAANEAFITLQKAPGSIQALHALALVEEAERLAAASAGKDRVFDLLSDAYERNAPYVLWYFTQPDSFTSLRDDPRYQKTIAAADEREGEIAAQAPSVERVAIALTNAQKTGHPRPAPQSSQVALLAQIATLSATLALLTWWTWAFFIGGGV